MSEKSEKNPLKQFALKMLIGAGIIVIFINIVLPDFAALNKSVSLVLEQEKSKAIILSFVQNPVVLYKLSEFDEKEGKIIKAILDIEVAIGLLEMHGATASTIAKYQARIDHLKSISVPAK